jgi:hypothetical protein
MRNVTGKFVWIALAISPAFAAECSTERVNRDCTVTINRLYPVNLPTIQMRHGSKLTVTVTNPLLFEMLTLDPQSAQAIAGTDQTAGLLSAFIPNLKGMLLNSAVTLPRVSVGAPNVDESAAVQKLKAQIEDELNRLDSGLTRADTALRGPVKPLVEDLLKVYAQIAEILSPVPRPLMAVAGSNPVVYADARPPGFPPTPSPWTNYQLWRQILLCEFDGADCSLGPPIQNTLGQIASVQKIIAEMPAMQNGKITWTDKTFITEGFDALAARIQQDISSLPQTGQSPYTVRLLNIQSREADLAAYSASITKPLQSAQQDFNAYALNIRLTPATRGKLPDQDLGQIYDPKCGPKTANCPKIHLGVQVSFAVNAVNEIATPALSVASSSQKKTIATVTVLYADPIFEVSTGAFFSTLPNRTFSNQTAVIQNSGSAPSQGNVYIAQSIVRPSVLPYAAANWRLGPDRTWWDGRRLAFYVTTAVALNPYNTTTEFAAGPSISYRSIMISALFHFGHDQRLTQGEYVGEVWCNQSATSTNKCSPSPPTPTTEKYWTGAFALGIGIRIPTLFGGTGR